MTGWPLLWPRARAEAARARGFFQRFAGKSLIVHEGLGADWLDELLKTGGGGSHFRIDLRHYGDTDVSPVGWLVQHLRPIALPRPLLVLAGHDAILLIRHLRQGKYTCHPGELPWFIDDIQERGRYHARIQWTTAGPLIEHGLSVDDNHVEISYGSLD